MKPTRPDPGGPVPDHPPDGDGPPAGDVGRHAPRTTCRSAGGCRPPASAPAQSVAERVPRLAGRPEPAAEPWFATGSGRAARADVPDEAVGSRVARRSADAAGAAAPVYGVLDATADPRCAALDTTTRVEDPGLGPVRMRNTHFRPAGSPGAVRRAGRPHGADTGAALTAPGPIGAGTSTLRKEGAL
ncbi:CoA transferase [Streptomyces toxytricini]|uniref:CoA transferase n=1 Tax=Streptomyces toxytricini TaxID=67369 RepID=A0ABW8EQG2_STRT5